MSTVARFSFHVLVIPLIYSTIANSVTTATIGNYWFVIVAAFGVLGISFLTATLLAIPFKLDKRDFSTLRISATFPNIVALPILIFPSLCEYRVVYDSFGEGEEKADLYESCVANSNTMIFLYFFAWSLLFWSLGYRNLTALATNGNENEQHSSLWKTLWRGVKQACLSPGFIAMMLGFITACIPPLQQALFDPGGYLRFLGGAVQTLGVASSPTSTMVVAASLVPQPQQERHDDEETEMETAANSLAIQQCNDDEATSDETNHGEEETTSEDATHVDNEERVPNGSLHQDESAQHAHPEVHDQLSVHDNDIPYESPIMSDPNFGPHQLRRRSSISRFRQSIRHRSRRIISPPTRSAYDMRKLLLWFTLSRLLVTPGIVVALIIALDYANLWKGPNLAKLVIIINSALPGALIVVVLLKSRPELAETAAVVARVYLPSYLLSIVTIAGWTALGLWISIPAETTVRA